MWREDKNEGVACGDGLPSRHEGRDQVGSSCGVQARLIQARQAASLKPG
jgi:hypothetical protein